MSQSVVPARLGGAAEVKEGEPSGERGDLAAGPQDTAFEFAVRQVAHQVYGVVEMVASQREEVARSARAVVEVAVDLRLVFEAFHPRLACGSMVGVDEGERRGRHCLDRSPPAHVILLCGRSGR